MCINSTVKEYFTKHYSFVHAIQYFASECCQFGLSTCILYHVYSTAVKHYSQTFSFFKLYDVIDIIIICIISLILLISSSFKKEFIETKNM